MSIKFPCTKCGACCRMMKEVIPAWAGEDGACIHLDENNMCKIYDDRPNVCKVDWDLHKSQWGDKVRDEAHFMYLNACLCNTMMDQQNLPKELRIDLGAKGEEDRKS